MLCSVLGTGLAAVASAQSPAAAPAANKQPAEITLEKFVVTGSNIPTAGDALAVPVTIIGRPDLEATGLDTNLLEVLQKRMPIFAGNGNLGATNSNVGITNTYGGSNVALRNLDTLVLLNGRRLPTSGANGRGGRSFVDLNQIPLAAVQSVEVLTDGASAIYGSDAVGGVVNVKLRNDFNGAEAGGRYAFSSRSGDYEERSGYVVVGAKRPGLSITVAASKSDTTPIYQADRPFSSPIVGRTATISGAVSSSSANFPTNFLRADLGSPSQAVPTGTAATAADLAALQASGVYPAGTFASIANTFDLSPIVTLLFDSKKASASLAAGVTLIPETLDLSIEGLYSSSKSFSQLAAQPTTSTVPVNSPYNPTRSSIFAAFRYTPAPRQYYNEGILKHFATELKGNIAKRFDWNIGYNYNGNRLVSDNANVIYGPNLQLAIAGGYDANGNAVTGGRFARVFRDFGTPPGLNTLAQYQAAITPANSVLQPALDIFARPNAVSAASIANLFGVSTSVFDSNLTQIDAKIAGKVFEIPTGDIGAALGIDYREETLKGTPDNNSRSSGPTAGRWQGSTFFDPFARDREIKAAFAEVRVPLIDERRGIPGLNLVEFTAAWRYEDYSDAGESKVPKYGLRWQPFDNQLTVRGTYSEAFTAPTLFALFGPTTQGFTPTAVIPNVFGINGQAQQRTGSNAGLKPSEAKTKSFGFSFSPKAIKGLTVTMDYIDVDQTSLVGSAGVTEILRSVEALGTASPYFSQVTIGNWATNPDTTLTTTASRVTGPGQLSSYLRAGNTASLIFVSDSNINIAGQKVRALDLAVNYSFPVNDYGKFKAGTTGTFFLDYQFQALPSQRYYEYAGHVTNGGTGAQGAVPGMRFYTTLDWSKGPWSAVLANTYIDELTDIGPGGITFASSTTLTRRPVASYSSWDTSVSYTFSRNAADSSWRKWVGGLRVSVGVNNIADKMPSLSPQAFNESNADVSTYSPVGRLWYISGQYKF